MKNATRIIIALLLLAMTLPMAVSCTRTETPEVTTESPETDPAPDTTEADDPDPPVTEEVLSEQTIPLNKNTAGIKILGVRNLKSDSAINCDWSASGIEFVATCEGDVTFAAESTKGCYFRAYVDGEAWNNGDTPYYTVEGTGTVVLKAIPKGTHTIRLIKVTGYTLANASLSSVTLTGYISEKAPEDKKLYIEFVGDSITCGWGTIGTFDGKYTSQDATLAYTYLLAEKLDADYSMTALSGQGICCGTPGVPLGYRYACYAKDSANEYDFARKANLVVVNIGTNDETKSIDKNQFKTDFENWIKFVKEKNGADCKILAVYNMKNGTYSDLILEVFANLGGEGAGYYTYKAKRSVNSTASYHPSIEEHAAYIPELVDICKAVLAGEKINEKEQGGDGVDNVSTLPENTVVVDYEYLSLDDGAVVTFTWNGQEHKAVVGKTAFGLLVEAQDALSENGTLILRPGTYSEQFQISKNITVLGPKAGIDPNVKSLIPGQDWSLSTDRGEGEAIITGNWGFGVWNATVYSDCSKIVVDGLQFSGAFLLRQNSAEEGSIRIEMKNILIKEITGTNNILFFYPYYPKNSSYNLYKRDLLLENIRVEGLTTKPLFRMCADKLEIAGMYMDSACTVGLFGNIGTSDTEGTDIWIIRDSMFRNSASTIADLKVKVDSDYRMANIVNKKLDITISGCTFSAEDSTVAHAPFIAIKRSDANVIVRIKDNTLLSNNTSSVLISDEGSDAAYYESATELSGNYASGSEVPFKFDNAFDGATIIAKN